MILNVCFEAVTESKQFSGTVFPRNFFHLKRSNHSECFWSTLFSGIVIFDMNEFWRWKASIASKRIKPNIPVESETK
jgi:hypothetical protein